jgi:hypothetical protein
MEEQYHHDELQALQFELSQSRIPTHNTLEYFDLGRRLVCLDSEQLTIRFKTSFLDLVDL